MAFQRCLSSWVVRYVVILKRLKCEKLFCFCDCRFIRRVINKQFVRMEIQARVNFAIVVYICLSPRCFACVLFIVVLLVLTVPYLCKWISKGCECGAGLGVFGPFPVTCLSLSHIHTRRACVTGRMGWTHSPCVCDGLCHCYSHRGCVSVIYFVWWWWWRIRWVTHFI